MDATQITQIIALLAGVLALIVAGIAYARSGQPVTFEGVTHALETTGPLAKQIRDVAEVIVAGIEQLKQTGKIQTNTEAFDTAMEHLQAWFPEVDARRLVPFIEAAVRGIKLAREVFQPDADSADGAQRALRSRGPVGMV